MQRGSIMKPKDKTDLLTPADLDNIMRRRSTCFPKNALFSAKKGNFEEVTPIP